MDELHRNMLMRVAAFERVRQLSDVYPSLLRPS
jgi:hypothetical protein